MSVLSAKTVRAHGQQAIAGELFPLLDTPDGQTPLGNSVAIVVVGFAASCSALTLRWTSATPKTTTATATATTAPQAPPPTTAMQTPPLEEVFLAVKKPSTAGREDSRGSGREGAAVADADYDGLSGGLLEAGSPVDDGSSAVRTENAPGGILAPDVQAFVGRKFDDMTACLARNIISTYVRTYVRIRARTYVP